MNIEIVRQINHEKIFEADLCYQDENSPRCNCQANLYAQIAQFFYLAAFDTGKGLRQMVFSVGNYQGVSKIGKKLQ